MEEYSDPQLVCFETDFGQRVTLVVHGNKSEGGQTANFVEFNIARGVYCLLPIAPLFLYFDPILWHHIEQELRERGVKMVNSPPANLRSLPTIC